MAGLGTGALVGLINGIADHAAAIPSFLVTLGTLSTARGLAMMVTDTKPVIITNETYFRDLRRRQLFLAYRFRSLWTLCGDDRRHPAAALQRVRPAIYAAGGNPTAALYSGINIKRVTTLRPSC